MNRSARNMLAWLFAGLLLVTGYNMLSGGVREERSELPYSELLRQVENGAVASVLLKGPKVEGVLNDGGRFTSYIPENAPLVQTLSAHNVVIKAVPEKDGSPGFFDLFIYWIPFFLLMGVWVFLMQHMQGGGNRALGFGRSRAKLLSEKRGRVTFADVAGIEEAKQELEEIVEFLRDPRKFQRLGGKIPKGMLMIGPPGTGKTLLARAIAGEAGVPFFIISGSDFVEMFVGVGASRVRDMFSQAKRQSPCIVFIDEIDAVGRHRGAGLGGGNDEREQTLNQLLVEMDGFDSNDGVILIAATNRPDVLDPALLRPGRFDRQVVVPNPDIIGREKILKVHVRKVKLAPDVKLKVIARGTPGLSGADLANLVNEATLLAARRDKSMVTMQDFEDAKDKVLMGAERRSMAMTDKERELTAYHEAGHALVGIHVAGNDPLHKVTIIPRGRALGVTMNLPERDRYSVTKKEVEARIAMAFGGRVAEELVFGKANVTSGAANDILQATSAARAMVSEWGMSERLGPLRYCENEREIFLGHSVTQRKNVSEATARIIDEEIKRIVEAGEKLARKTLTEHKAQLRLLSATLLERETLSGDEVATLLREGSLPPLHDEEDGGETSTTHATLPAAGMRPRPYAAGMARNMTTGRFPSSRRGG